jgi:hypothetical protein
MDRESVERLRFDRRLERRRGWVEDADRDAHLESLPDVSEKMIRGFDDPEEEAQAAEPVLGAFPRRESTAEPGSFAPGGASSGAPIGGMPFGGRTGGGSEFS